MRKKLKDTSGLTMVEMLCATVILVLLCLMMSTGMQMALKSYHTLTAESETQLLLSSLTDALSDKLRYCVMTEKTGGSKENSIGKVGFFDGKVIVTEPGADPTLLLPAGAYGEANADGNRRYQVETLVLDPIDSAPMPVFTVTLKVKDTQTGIFKETTLSVRCLNPVKKERIPS